MGSGPRSDTYHGGCYGCWDADGLRHDHDAMFTDSRTGYRFCHEHVLSLVMWELDGCPTPDEYSYPEWITEPSPREVEPSVAVGERKLGKWEGTGPVIPRDPVKGGREIVYGERVVVPGDGAAEASGRDVRGFGWGSAGYTGRKVHVVEHHADPYDYSALCGIIVLGTSEYTSGSLCPACARVALADGLVMVADAHEVERFAATVVVPT